MKLRSRVVGVFSLFDETRRIINVRDEGRPNEPDMSWDIGDWAIEEMPIGLMMVWWVMSRQIPHLLKRKR